MRYPEEILPNPIFKLIDCDLSDYFVLRIIPTTNLDEIWDNESNSLRIAQICSNSERIQDLSVSLFGIYTNEHIFIRLTEEGNIKYNDCCKPDDTVEIPLFETDFILDTNRHFWVAPIKKLANQNFDYKTGNVPCNATCLVTHTPMKWNYWHFSIRWQTNLGRLEDLEERQRNNIAKKIGHSVKSVFAKFATITPPDSPVLPNRCYCKN